PGSDGFTALFDGTATGTPHSLDKWLQVGAGGMELQADGSLKTLGGLGMLWFPGQEFGDVSFRVDFRDPGAVNAGINGGVFVRFPDLRVPLADRPTGYTYAWPGRPGPWPPAQTYRSDPASADPGNRTYCGRTGAANGDGADAMAWFSIFCGQEIQVLDSTSGDAIKTGSVYNFANLDIAASGLADRAKNTWHTMEIRLVGQQYTILVDGVVLNQFDNAIPQRSSRGGDPPSTARQFATGFIGLQNHDDGLFFRAPRAKELTAPPANTRRPAVRGSGRVGDRLTCTRGAWDDMARGKVEYAWFRGDPSPSVPPGTAPTAEQVGAVQVADSRHYRATADDIGKVVWCQVTATNAEGGTAWATGRAPEVRARH
ncbi:MAG: 3-keto-disaccharide hydrolase, partial [Actinomadura sp.]